MVSRMYLAFEPTDVVQLRGGDHDEELYYVTGIIHSQHRLFVTGKDNEEFEVPFNVVRRWWVSKDINEAAGHEYIHS